MPHYVYMLKTINGKYNKTYVGYTNNLKKRIELHNKGKGAKSTKGYKWELVYKRRFLNKSRALSYEMKLKKNRSKRLSLIDEYIKKKN